MNGVIKTGDTILVDGKAYISISTYKDLKKDLIRKDKMLDILVEELEYRKGIVANKNNMKISRT